MESDIVLLPYEDLTSREVSVSASVHMLVSWVLQMDTSVSEEHTASFISVEHRGSMCNVSIRPYGAVNQRAII
jgi:hypothetical protein